MSAEAPAWVDPMLQELAASLIMSGPAGATVAGCPSALAVAAQEDTSLVDTCSPVKEVTTSLVVSPPAGALAHGCSLAPAAASQEADTSLVDTYSPAKVAQWTTDTPPLSPMQGPPQVTPPRGIA